MTKTELEKKHLEAIIDSELEKYAIVQPNIAATACALISQSHAKETAEAFDVWKHENLYSSVKNHGIVKYFDARIALKAKEYYTFTQLYDLYLESVNEK